MGGQTGETPQLSSGTRRFYELDGNTDFGTGKSGRIGYGYLNSGYSYHDRALVSRAVMEEAFA
jgi:hypothetical protein